MTLYKFTAADGSSFYGGTGHWRLGRWRSVSGPLVACERGLHLCRADQLIEWLAPALWVAEVDGELLDAGDKLVARRARIVRRVDAWNERTARLFAADCAERVLPIFEATHPGDSRPREAIAVARRYAEGQATRLERDAARAAARAAAEAAAGDAAWDDAWDAARDAARAAARAAAGAAAGAAARDAAWAAARAAARAAAGAAAWAAERAWQSQHLIEMLGLTDA